MKALASKAFGRRGPPTPWSDTSAIRQEIFGAERLEQHARSLAAAQRVTTKPVRVVPLHSRLNDDAAVLLAAYRASAAELEAGRTVVPAAEWLLDNYHLVDEQVLEVRGDLPDDFYRQLPKLADGPFAGYPRVFGLAWAFVAHTDSRFDPDMLRRFIAAYQEVEPLTIGELWAVAITLRIVLVENLRRLTDEITAHQAALDDADALADRLFTSLSMRAALEVDIAALSSAPLSDMFAARLAKRLRDQDPRTTPALGWLEERLRREGATVDDVMQRVTHAQGAANVTVQNVITSMKLISSVDWADLVESVSLVDERLRAASDFAAMDFETRNEYRNAIEELARGSSYSEIEVTDLVLAAADAAAREASDAQGSERLGDPGFHLIDEGRRPFERSIRFRVPRRLRLRRFVLRLGVGGYVAAILILTVTVLALASWALASVGIAAGLLALFAIFALVPATDVATAVVNLLVTRNVGTRPLPGLELASGVPPALRTLIVVPTMLTNEADLVEQVERLEVHHLAGSGGHVTFALLADRVDADTQVHEKDERLLAVTDAAIAHLNDRYGPGPDGDRFLLLHRRRVFNPGEDAWMGWERKRGKLHELNRLLRGATDTTFASLAGAAPEVPADVRYVITLDADTRLPRGAARQLVGKMAHPLNRPTFDAQLQRVVAGYGILQPRVTPSLPVGVDGSRYQHAYSGPGGMDPYASAVSDVYQDLFGEGSYTGKGIYDVDAFEAALAGRIPENAMLSHDLFEGVFVRAGLASDIEVVEDAPSRYDVAAGRQHRWTRGDWQLLPWLFGRGAALGAVPRLGRWKMLDNLRRSLVAPATFLTLVLCWLFPLRIGLVAESLVLAAIALPAFLPILTSLAPSRPGVRFRSHVVRVAADLQLAGMQTWFTVAFVADRAWRMVDAIARTLARLYLTHRHLLEWTTAAAAAGAPRPDLVGYYRQMAGSTVLVFLMAAAAVTLAPSSWPSVAPFALAWLTAPALAVWASRSKPVASLAVSAAEAHDLRLIARRTWRYFETFVTPASNMLPPDNFQEDPSPVVAQRTSPTNIGLYLLSTVAARDFGWAGTTKTVERLEATFDVIRRLPKHEGHLFNWYATTDLRVLEPAYVSSVDSGNLAGHLIAVANACEEWIGAARAPSARLGMLDALRLARQAGATSSGPASEHDRVLARLLDELEIALTAADGDAPSSPAVRELIERSIASARSIGQALSDDRSDAGTAERIHWVEALRQSFVEHDQDAQGTSVASLALDDRLRALSQAARALAMGMNFSFLLDAERTLLSIGYSLTENRLDPSCYDLLASEARLASLVAIAKRDVETEHWFHVGRAATPVGRGSVLLSWSGSMFEYLMPALVMHAPIGSLLEQTQRRAVVGQRAYGRLLGVPWGASESGYNARDLEFTYQYSAFGVPGLGLKRGLADDVVIAPYATALATMVDPRAAHRNFAQLADMGALGRYGYYEALDFTRSRLPEGAHVAIVRSFMAHHQGMTVVAIANCLLQSAMRSRFHREPIIQASELLLQERMPRDVVVAHPKAEEVRAAKTEARADVPAARRLSASAAGPPMTHLLSNGHYTVMVTAAGSGYSRWGDVAVTRWREDPTRDPWGSFVFLRDARSGELWSAGAQPVFGVAKFDVVCDEDHATFTRRDGALTTSMAVIVSGEDDGEVRRVTLVNRGRRAREIELTSYAELALTTPAADDAHPAFAKMFVQTEHLAEFGALVAMRRPRSETEPRVWAAHFAVVDGTSVGVPQFESDRARFIGRGRSIATAEAIDDGLPLSNTVGTVLDPIFSLRRRVVIPPGAVARVDFWTLVASTREELLGLIDRHHDSSAYGRAKTLAWTQAQVQFHHLGIDAREAAEFQRLASPILYADARYRAPPEAIRRGAGPQSGLWPHGISGDLPIVLVHIDDVADMPQVRQLLRAHEYWRTKRLAVDLVIVNEHAASYRQELQNEIDTAVRSSASRPRPGHTLAEGSVYALRADLMSSDARSLLRSVARVTVNARRGPVAEAVDPLPPAPARPWTFQLPEARRPSPSPTRLAPPQRSTSTNRPLPPRRPPPTPGDLEFFNGIGGFASDGREYVTILDAGRTTPAPWVNVIANPLFGFQVSADGSGYTWAENGRENQLTPWSNDPVVDPPGEAIYVRDDATGELWTATAKPIRDAGRYVVRHGHGYSRFEHEVDGIALELLQFVPLGDPIKVSRLRLRNLSRTPRRLSVTAYTEWVLGRSRAATAPFITTDVDAVTGALLATNPWSTSFPGRVAFADLGGRQTSWTADRSEFLGRRGGMSAPASLVETKPMSGSTGAGLDPCAALQCKVELGAGEAIDVVSFVGQCASVDEARALLARYRERDLDTALDDVTRHWNDVLGAVKVKTPDRAMDLMLNGWLLYQTIACRTWARSAFYQASGAYGFRDQLQDYMASTFARPEDTRRHLLRAASRQFLEGDVQHWWLPHSGQGVRTHISDDVVWLAFATATYVEVSGDHAVLDEIVPFLDGPLVPKGDHDAFFQPMIADASGTLFEHCARGLDLCIERTGAHGLPLIGTGDWNDGMNRVGEGGRGESVWLGWFLLRTIEMLAGTANERDPDRALRWTTHAAALKQAIEREAWDGAWYRRATYDDGTWLGSKDSEACRIDSIAQTWAVLSGAADPARARRAMASLREHLIRSDDGLALLFTPPFDAPTRDPGYIRAYPPGLRENGGQYSHAAMWAILAYTRLDAGDEAAELFALLNPIHHGRTLADVERYKVEPYVVAADVYSVAPHVGRGGWTWYTGSAAWMQRAGVEGILGIRREGGFLVVDPRTPSAWPGFEATVTIASTRYEIRVATPADGWRDDARATLDGAPIDCHRGLVRVPLDGGVHRLALTVPRASSPHTGSPTTGAVGAPSSDGS